MEKIVLITGLTASGKSNLAVEIAKQYNGEIISADSVQIYKNLNIGSAKITEQEKQNIPHYLIDIKDSNQTYSVGEFVFDAQNAIKQIIAKGKLPIVVGGTGLYFKALLNGYNFGENEPNLALRDKYYKMAEEQGNMAVWLELNKLNPEKAKAVHFNNIKRVIRYLEIELTPTKSTENIMPLKEYNVCAVGVVADRELIYDKINKRVDTMIKMGLMQEVKTLIDSGLTQNNQSMQSIGYKEWFDYFVGNTTLEQTIDLIKQHSRNYCKRQLTFLKTIQGLELYDYAQAEQKIKEFLNNAN